MSEGRYPHGESLFPDTFDEHTVLFLVRPPDAPDFSADELERLQAEHLAYLRELARRGVLVANGPLSEQTDPSLRGLSIYALPLPEALGLARADPMVRAGRLAIDGGRWATQAGSARFGNG